MMQWLLVFLLAVAVLTCWQIHRRVVARFRMLRGAIQKIRANQTPTLQAIPADGEFSEVVEEMAALGNEHTVLRKDRLGEAANFEAFLATMEEGVLVADARHVIRRANPSLIAMFSLRQDPVGQTVLTALRGVEIERIISATLQTGRQHRADHEITQVKPVRQVAMTATPMRHVSGEPSVVLTLRDMTRLRQLEDVRREFVANVSHELRTPLAIFQGYLETLIETPDLDRAETVEILNVLKRHSMRLNLLVEDLLILARLESRHERMKIEPIELGEFLDGAMQDWMQRSGRKKVRLTVSADEDEVDFFGDRLRLEQVVSNLIDNAVKYTEPGGEVSVRGTRVEGQVEIRVADTGIGIPPTDLPHIFERFYRADKARSRDQGGTGLGLSIVKHIAQTHGGTVVAESTFGRGTTITVRLPLRPVLPDGSGAKPGSEMESAIDAGENETKAGLAP